MKRHLAAALLLVACAPAAAEEQSLEALLTAGQPIYESNCAACHSKSGGGLVGPSFIGNDRIASDSLVFRQLTDGGSDMPSFAKKLTIEQMIAVGTYIRNSWGNAYGILTEPKAD